MRRALIAILALTSTAWAVDDAEVIAKIRSDPESVWSVVKGELTAGQLATVYSVVGASTQEQTNVNGMVLALKSVEYTDNDTVVSELLVKVPRVSDDDIITYIRKRPAKAMQFLRNHIDAEIYHEITRRWRLKVLEKTRATEIQLAYDTTAIDAEIALHNTSLLAVQPTQPGG